METMKAAIVYAPGGPEALKVEHRPVPVAHPGEVLVRVRAFGPNRSELFTRQGHSPNVRFPRILEVEATGTVALSPGGEFAECETVATAMGGMGRDFDGRYAEFAKVPAQQMRVLRTGLPLERLGALPEMHQSAWKSLFVSLRLEPGKTLQGRGGTTSVGLAAVAIAKAAGAIVCATTRRPEPEALLRSVGADHVFVDDGSIAGRLRRAFPQGGAIY